MKKHVYIEKDESNAIVMSKDHYKGLTLQVVRFVDQQVPNDSGELVTHRTMMVVHQENVPLSIDNQEVYKQFDTLLKESIQRCKQKLADIRKADQKLDEVLSKTLEQHKALNDDER